LPTAIDSLSAFLACGDWRVRFDEEILTASRSFVSKTRGIILDEEPPDGFTLSGDIHRESCRVSLWPGTGSIWEFETTCTCDVGACCHHAAALLEKATRERNLPRLLGHSIPDAVERMIPAQQRRLARESKGEATPPPEESQPHDRASNPTTPNSFHLHVRRAPVTRILGLLLQSLGEKNAESWITATAEARFDTHTRILRDAPATTITAAENIAARQLEETGLSSLHGNSSWQFLLNLATRKKEITPDCWFPDPSRIPIDAFWHQFRGEMAPRLEALGWQLTFDESVGHRVFDADPATWNTDLEPRDGGWFSLSVGFTVGGEKYDLLPILAGLLENDFLEETLDRPDTGHVYAPLPNGDALKLPTGRVRRILRHLAALIDPKFPGKTRLHALDAAALTGLDGLGIDPPHEVGELAAKLRDFQGLASVEQPAGLQATLRDYQAAGFRWMQFLARHGLHGILADDMGLGKTLQTITHILSEKQAGHMRGLPALVVAPTSVVPNWRAEIARFAPELRVLILNGPDRRKYFRSIPHADVVLTSYALLQRDIEKLREHPFHLAILDEAQHIKNPAAKVAQAACKLDAAHRLCLSGTPVENHLGELWSLMRFLIPGFLGSQETFNKRFRNPIEKDGCPERNAALKARVAPLILRRTKDQVATELPPKTELVHLVELHTAQKDLYETVRAAMDKRVRQAMAARGNDGFQMVFLDALLKLRQICCDPRLLPPEFSNSLRESAKLDYLIELLDVLLEEGRRILIFSQFTTMLGLIEAHLKARQIPHLILTGASKDRGALVERFQSGSHPVFLISLKAGGTGLNLTAADTVIHYDPWWNPAAQAQATDRAYRIGQDKPVFVHKLLCQNTVEERIHKLQQEKAKLADGLLADADITQKLSPEMVRALLE
jgi:superfamily II DNA or RNA helicase